LGKSTGGGLRKRGGGGTKCAAAASRPSQEKRASKRCVMHFADDVSIPPGSARRVSRGSPLLRGTRPSAWLRFVEAVEDAIQRILESPERWRVLDDDVRRCLTHVFPYGILYTIEPEFILIVAVMPVVASPAIGRAESTRLKNFFEL
jgi:hypothetical protein